MWTVAQLERDLIAGRTTSRELIEQALAKITAPYGEGARAFMKVYAESARADADYADRLRKQGVRRSPIDGLPVSLKDLFDVAGDVTRAGSKVLAIEATQDASAVARLRAAGAILIGRTNMVEFAFGGVGLNPHYGTPRNPWDRAAARVPGGSSSGAAVAQAEGMCVIALRSDTPRAVRPPATPCGGGLAGAEVVHVHKPYRARFGEYDPRVGKRVSMGTTLTGADYVELLHLRAEFMREIETLAAPYDAIVMPTVPCVAPTIAETEASEESYFRWNFRIMRNNGLINFLDGCAVTMPCHEQGAAPVGFMVCGTAGSDRRILAVAAAVERALSAD